VDIEIPKQRDEVMFANVDCEDGTDENTSERPSAEDYHLITEKLARLGEGIKDDEADDADEDSSLQETAGEHSNQKTLVQSGIEPSQERRTRKGVYGFQKQSRNLKVNFWRQPTTEERQGGIKVELDASQGHEGNPPPEKISENKKYGFPKREDRDTSGPWRQDTGGKEGPGDNRSDLLKSWSLSSPDSAGRDGDSQDGDQSLVMKNYKETSGVDQSLSCNRGVCLFDKASQHRDMNIWGWGQK
jgi:hypothetical protein